MLAKQYMVCFVVFSFFSIVAQAQVLKKTAAIEDVKVNDVELLKLEKKIISRLKEPRPDLSFSGLKRSPLKGLYRINVNGRPAYVSEDGKYLLSGEMYEVTPKQLVNLQEVEREIAERAFAPQRAKLLDAVDKKDMVIFTPESAVKAYVNVFSDIDCPFCRRFHREIPAFLAKGIEVRYLAFPLGGLESNSAKKLVTTWCSPQPQEAMTRFKSGEDIPLIDCGARQVEQQYKLGQQVGITGTPAIVLPSGKLIPGAVSAEMLAAELGL